MRGEACKARLLALIPRCARDKLQKQWSTSVQMAQLGYWLGWEAANAASMPTWKPGDEFRAARDKSLTAVK